MLPINTPQLRLAEIAKYWSRELDDLRTQSEIYRELLGAYWRGDLTARWGPVTESSAEGRQRLLQSISRARVHSGFTLVEDTAAIPILSETLPDGSVSLDVTRYIVLPGEPARWTESIVREAGMELASVHLEGFDRLVQPLIGSLTASKEDLGAYCDRTGYQHPAFWFGTATSTKAKSFGGRPSVMREIEAEMVRRAGDNALAATLRKEATALRVWAEKQIDPAHQIPTARAIENALRKRYRELRTTAAPATKHKTA
jgi:hypothetical protein